MFTADNLELKHCFTIAKELYESLKRLERKRELLTPYGPTKASLRIKARERAYSYPFEYYSFKDGEVVISIARESGKYYVTSTNWYSKRYWNAVYNKAVDGFALEATKSLSDAVDFWRQVVNEYLTHSIGLF